MSEHKRNKFQEKVQKFLSGRNTPNKRSRCSEDEDTSMKDIKGICKYLNII